MIISIYSSLPRAVSVNLQLGGGALQVERRVRRGPAARVPDGGALQEHLLAVAEGVPALAAARARRVEVVVLARLRTPTHTPVSRSLLVFYCLLYTV